MYANGRRPLPSTPPSTPPSTQVVEVGAGDEEGGLPESNTGALLVWEGGGGEEEDQVASIVGGEGRKKGR